MNNYELVKIFVKIAQLTTDWEKIDKVIQEINEIKPEVNNADNIIFKIKENYLLVLNDIKKSIDYLNDNNILVYDCTHNALREIFGLKDSINYLVYNTNDIFRVMFDNVLNHLNINIEIYFLDLTFSLLPLNINFLKQDEFVYNSTLDNIKSLNSLMEEFKLHMEKIFKLIKKFNVIKIHLNQNIKSLEYDTFLEWLYELFSLFQEFLDMVGITSNFKRAFQEFKNKYYDLNPPESIA